jgi:hypothetical protein
MAPMPDAPTRQQKITLGEMRSSGVRGILVYCADYRCAHAVRISADRWPDMFGCPISSRCLSVRRAAGAAPISGPTGTGNCRDGALVADRGWKRRFQEPIPLPRGRQLVTLEDAGNYITKLPKAEHEAPEWQAAMEALILVATSGGPTMFARIGIMRALSRA